jgi:hypothetical protein
MYGWMRSFSLFISLFHPTDHHSNGAFWKLSYDVNNNIKSPGRHYNFQTRSKLKNQPDECDAAQGWEQSKYLFDILA